MQVRARRRERSPDSRNARRAVSGTWVIPALAGLAMGVILFVFYFAVYRARGYDLPIGFDASWYIWRAEFAAELGIGPVGTDVRPGHALLSSVLGSVTGRPQLELAVILPLVLVGVFALATGGFLRSAGLDRPGAAIGVLVAGTVLGTTRLIGENVANLLLLALVVAAVVSVGRWIAGGRGFWGAVALLVAAGLAHWMFLAVVGAILAVGALMAVPSSLAARRAGTPLLRTEAGALAAVAATTGAVMAAAIGGLLRAPFGTFEIREDPERFGPKLRNDLRRVLLPPVVPIALIGAAATEVARRRSRPASASNGGRQGFPRRVLGAWVLVSVAGVAYGGLTEDVPPHRFLALLVAVPVAVAVAVAVAVLAARTRKGLGTVAAAVVAVAAIALVALPGGLSWYRQGPGVWLDAEALHQAHNARAYLEGLPPGEPVVFLVGPFGRAGVLSVPLKERTIRVAIQPDRQEDLHLFVGELEDALAGRRTLFEGEKTNEAAEPYWEAVRPVLPSRPPVVILRRFAPAQYARATGFLGAIEAGPGVAVLRPAATGLQPSVGAPDPSPVPTIEEGTMWAAVLLLLLGMGGAGWTRAMLGWGVEPETWVALAPAVGAGMLVLGALPIAAVGLGTGGPAGIAVWVAVAGGGWAAGWWRRRDGLEAGGVGAPGLEGAT